LFRERNLGLKSAVSGAIDWFFETESEGIILEDDCLAEPTFFPFCDELLDRYRDDKKIGSICGMSYMPRGDHGHSYYATQLTDFWGWATWRDRWALMDLELAKWPAWRDSGGLDRLTGMTPRARRYWTRIFDRTASGWNSWGYAWLQSFWREGLLSLHPSVPLIWNAGFGPDATHTIGERLPGYCRPSRPLTFPLDHPLVLVPTERIERFIWHFRYDLSLRADLRKIATLPYRAIRKALRIVSRRLASSTDGIRPARTGLARVSR
jgi:hypothetical protein